jgi:hypothetical protein
MRTIGDPGGQLLARVLRRFGRGYPAGVEAKPSGFGAQRR